MTNNAIDCEYLEEKGRHSFTAVPDSPRDHNGDPVNMVCRYCPETFTNNVPDDIDFGRERTWEAASAGMSFAEDLNADGTIKTDS